MILAARIRLFGMSFVASILASHSALAETAGPLFTYKGKAYSAKELSPALQQTLFDLESESAQRMQAFADQAVLNIYVDEEAKKSGKDRKTVEDHLFAGKDASDKDAKDWFEANKARIPPGYQFDQIKDDIKQILKGEQKKKQRDELLAKIKKEGAVTVNIAKPVAPQVDISSDGFPMKGEAKAKVTIVEFADYQCPHCKEAVKDIASVLKKYSGKVKLVFLDFPINPSGVSLTVAHGAYCAGEQKKFWEYHEKAYDQQSTLDKDSPVKLAKDLKLDEGKFTACLASEAAKKHVEKAKAEGERVGVSGTPSIYINGRRVLGHGVEEMSKEIDAALKGAA